MKLQMNQFDDMFWYKIKRSLEFLYGKSLYLIGDSREHNHILLFANIEVPLKDEIRDQNKI